MRTLHADLTTAQQGASGTPYLEIVLTSPDTLTTYTYKTTDSPSRIYKLGAVEGVWGTAQKSKIVLKNYDQFFSLKDLRGYKVDIGWGYNTSSGNRISNQQPLWVKSQTDTSEQGILYTELELGDVWWRLLYSHVVGGGTKLVGTITGTFTLSESVTSSGGATATKVLVQGTGHIVVTGVSGTFLSGETVTGNSSGAFIVLTADGDSGGLGAAPAWTTTSIKDILSSLIADVAVLQDDTAGADANILLSPEMTTESMDSSLTIIRRLMEMTYSMLRMESDGKMHLKYLDPAHPVDYTYSTAHVHWLSDRTQTLIIPNKIIVVDVLPQNGTPTYIGSSFNATSVAAIGPVVKLVEDNQVTSDAEAVASATSILSRLVDETLGGSALVPMNCGQELLDWVSVVDTRANITMTGRVSKIERLFESGNYQCKLTLGTITDALDLSSPEALITSMLTFGYGKMAVPGDGVVGPINSPSATIPDSNVLFTDITTGDVTTTKHGFAQKAVAPAVNVRNVHALDNAESTPSWKTALDATNPTTIGVSDTPAPGTSLVFSHRDHQHGSPATFTPSAHNVLSATHGDALAASAILGDIIHGNATPKWARLAGNITAIKKFLNQTGSGAVSAVPSWDALVAVDYPDMIGDSGAGGTKGAAPAPGAGDAAAGKYLKADATWATPPGGAAAHAILDGSVHTDSLAGAVVDGDVIIGNVTPKWSRLAISIPAASVRNVLGIDNGELRPSWKTTLDATNPANIAAAAGPGTSLVYSHRDHVHAHPDLGDLHTGYFLANVSRNLTGGYANFKATGDNVETGWTYVNSDDAKRVKILTNNNVYIMYTKTAADAYGEVYRASIGSTTPAHQFSGNVGLGTSTFGTSADKVVGLATGTEPSTSPADMVQLYSVDRGGGGGTILGIRTEYDVVTETVLSTHTFTMKINGTEHLFLLA